MDTSKKNNIKKLIAPVVIAVIALIGYFIYQGFIKDSGSDLNVNSNSYISETKLGKNYDIINKESINFDTNINNSVLDNGIDFSQIVYPSGGTGRANPFLP